MYSNLEFYGTIVVLLFDFESKNDSTTTATFSKNYNYITKSDILFLKLKLRARFVNLKRKNALRIVQFLHFPVWGHVK